MKKLKTITLAVVLTSALSLGTVGAHANTGAGMNSPAGTTSTNTSAYGTSATASPSTLQNQINYGTTSIRAYDTTTTKSNASNWGWLGLIGLFGLAGLRSRNDVREK